MIRQGLLFVATFLSFVTHLNAQPAPVARLMGPFVETVRPEPPVSGVDILGIVVLGDHLPRGAEKIFVRSPGGRPSSVCVEMVTRDGGYIASGTFDLPATVPGGYVFIPIFSETKYPHIFRAAVLQDLAILARIGRCDERGDFLIPTAWGAPPPPTAVMRFAVTVQGARNQAFLRTGAGAEATRVSCTRIRAASHTAFDAYCEISLPANRSSAVSLQVERCAFGECTRSPSIQILP